MKTEEIIKNTHVQLKTSLPFYSEVYEFNSSVNNPFHSHEFFEIGITLEGSAVHVTSNSQKFVMPGSVYMIPIGESHRVSTPEFWRVLNLYLLPRLTFQSLNSTFHNSILEQFLLRLTNKGFNSIVHLSLSEAAVREIESLAETYKKITLSNNYLLDNYRSNCLLNILMILCDAYYKEIPGEAVNNDVRIYTIINLIHENIFASTGYILSAISQKLLLHPQYVNKIVKKALNTTLSNLVLETKVEKSCELLINNCSITETAQALAFYDHSHYNKYFIKYFGISPSQYRDKYSTCNY